MEISHARQKYLYLDGAYGFWPQLLMALGIPAVFKMGTAIDNSDIRGILRQRYSTAIQEKARRGELRSASGWVLLDIGQ